MHPSSRAGSFRPGPFGIHDAGAPTIDGLGVIHLEPDLRDASLVGVNHVVTMETWSGKDESMPEIVVDNLAFPDILEENCLGFKKDLEPAQMSMVGDFGVLLTGRSQCLAP